MHQALSLVTCTLAVLLACASTEAAVIQINNGFTSFPNRFVADIGNPVQFPLPLGADNVLGPFTVGGVTITPANAPLFSGLYFASGSTGGGLEHNTADVPGNVAGAVVSDNASFFQNPLPNLILNFSQPVLGFGATFLHDISGLPAQLNTTGAATISVFAGPNGTGTLLGSISDQGGVNILDFIGLLSDTPDIQSAVLSSSSAFGAFQLDAYGLSVSATAPAPVPEPRYVSVLFGLVAAAIRVRLYRPEVSK